MSPIKGEHLHNPYCANRNVVTASILVGGCAWVLVGFWNGSRKPHTVDSGAFSLFIDACILLGVGFAVTIFKCIRERIVIALWLLGPAMDLLFAAISGLAKWAGFAYRLELAAYAIAFIVSISMLTSALRGRNRPSVTPCV
jgi:hypothetical protein